MKDIFIVKCGRKVLFGIFYLGKKKQLMTYDDA